MKLPKKIISYYRNCCCGTYPTKMAFDRLEGRFPTSHDVTAALLARKNNESAAMLVSQRPKPIPC